MINSIKLAHKIVNGTFLHTNDWIGTYCRRYINVTTKVVGKIGNSSCKSDRCMLKVIPKICVFTVGLGLYVLFCCGQFPQLSVRGLTLTSFCLQQ